MIKEALFKFLKLEGLIENLSSYIETRVELFKIEIREDVSRLLATVILASVVMIVFLFFLILLSVGIAYYIGTMIGMTGGFTIVAGFYLLTTLLLLAFRKSIHRKLEKQLLEIVQQKVK